MTPTFTVLIGSIGRPELRHALDSIHRQARVPGDQVIVSIDSFEQGDRPDVQALVGQYGGGFHVCAYDSGYHFFGVEQINYALRAMPITGSHLVTIGDDDVFVDGAYETLRPICAADPSRPVLYRFLAPWREVLWDRPQMRMGRISGCCIAAPRACVGPMPTQTTWPGTTRPYVEHDYHWMVDIVAKAPSPPVWLDRTLVIARPDVRGDDVAHRGVVQCGFCALVRYLEDVDLLQPYCPQCRAVTDFPGRPVAMVGAS